MIATHNMHTTKGGTRGHSTRWCSFGTKPNALVFGKYTSAVKAVLIMNLRVFHHTCA